MENPNDVQPAAVQGDEDETKVEGQPVPPTDTPAA
jgi:hypothetical protein